MALYFRNVRRISRPDAMKVLIQKRFLVRLSPTETFLAKSTKPSLVQRSTLGLKAGAPLYVPKAEFHHLAEHTLICSVAFMNLGLNFAKAPTTTGEDGPKLGNKPTAPNDYSYSAAGRLALEKQRLRNKGAMKNIPSKDPDPVKNS